MHILKMSVNSVKSYFHNILISISKILDWVTIRTLSNHCRSPIHTNNFTILIMNICFVSIIRMMMRTWMIKWRGRRECPHRPLSFTKTRNITLRQRKSMDLTWKLSYMKRIHNHLQVCSFVYQSYQQVHKTHQPSVILHLQAQDEF